MDTERHDESQRAGEAPVGERSPMENGAAGAAGAAGGAGALVEPAEQAVARLEAEVADLRDRYLRLAADYDNFRKRAARERAEVWARAQAEVVGRLVDALDDLARFAGIDPVTTDTKTVHDAAVMVERKVWKELEALGVTRVDQVGVPFDPAVHEAVTTAPAERPEHDQTVGAVLQPGYRLGDALIRPARVLVRQWRGEAPPGAAAGGEGPAATDATG
jgi:molecular chaperone GrpE